jgi:predicted acyl esterase
MTAFLCLSFLGSAFALTKADVIYRKAPTLSNPNINYPGFKPSTTIIPKGTVIMPGYKPLECDILFERDVAIKMRDGVTLYADIYRPVGDEKVPAILNSTTFGKSKAGTGGRGPGIPTPPEVPNAGPGVPKSWVSGLQTFEGTDPGFFVKNGYAVVNLDIRGCYMSEGSGQYFGTQEAIDDYDTIEWLAAQDWNNGHVAMTGNSWLGIDQWFAAAEQPPHLTVIAPWEGWSDMYRDEYMIGGIADIGGFRYDNSFSDTELMEDVVANALAHPFIDEYWEDKAARLDKITVPMYVTASWTSGIHCSGTLNAWRNVASKDKWIRIHNTQEWRDMYNEEHSLDMLKFFDYYMKDQKNGWEKTPKIKVSVLDPGGTDIVERVENEFPLARQELTELYLDASDLSVHETPVKKESSLSYSGWDEKSVVKFSHTFDKESEIVGYMNLKLWVESFGYNDMDIFVKVSKVGTDGEYKYHYPVPPEEYDASYSGPKGRQRVSLRKLDSAKSTVNEPYHTFDETQKLLPHEIVPVEINIWPTALRFHPGETIEIAIAGFPYGVPMPHGVGMVKQDRDNNGNHIVHTGGQYDSKLIVPFIPIN